MRIVDAIRPHEAPASEMQNDQPCTPNERISARRKEGPPSRVRNKHAERQHSPAHPFAPSPRSSIAQASSRRATVSGTLSLGSIGGISSSSSLPRARQIMGSTHAYQQ